MNEQESRDRQISPFNSPEPYGQASAQGQTVREAKLMSPRAYNLALTVLVCAGFVVMGLCSSLFGDVRFLLAVIQNFGMFSIGCFVASIAGIILMGVAKGSQRVGLSLAGYAVFTLSFGFTTSIAMLQFSLETISNAFLATAGITVVFGCLGIAFPRFFEKIQGVLAAGLLGVIPVQVVMMLMGVQTGLIDFIVIVLFCGFIARDFYVAAMDAPTLANAAFHASNLFLDIINVFVRILSIFGRDN